MYCLTCKKVYPDTDDKCPHCGASPIPERCPECYTRLLDGADICQKCGCDIKKHIKEKEEKANYVAPGLKDKLRALPLYVKIGVPLVLIVLIIALVSLFGYIKHSRLAEAQRNCEELIVLSEDAVDMISEMALHYENDVYNRDWINHIENAEELREKHADKIKDINRTREPVTYTNDLVADSGEERLASLANDVYYAYTSCYAYVIGEKGKYPHYLENYNKVLSEYKTAVKKLKKELK